MGSSKWSSDAQTLVSSLFRGWSCRSASSCSNLAQRSIYQSSLQNAYDSRWCTKPSSFRPNHKQKSRMLLWIKLLVVWAAHTYNLLDLWVLKRWWKFLETLDRHHAWCNAIFRLGPIKYRSNLRCMLNLVRHTVQTQIWRNLVQDKSLLIQVPSYFWHKGDHARNISQVFCQSIDSEFWLILSTLNSFGSNSWQS